jgi:hypothetical protein
MAFFLLGSLLFQSVFAVAVSLPTQSSVGVGVLLQLSSFSGSCSPCMGEADVLVVNFLIHCFSSCIV